MSEQGSSGRIELCQWATVNPDGTHTVVRGGLDHWDAPLPLDLLIWVFVELPPAVKAGSHPFVLNVLSPDGLTVAQVNGIVVVGSEKRTMFSLPLQASIQKYGPWKVRFASAEVTCETSLEIRPNQGGSASGNV